MSTRLCQKYIPNLTLTLDTGVILEKLSTSLNFCLLKYKYKIQVLNSDLHTNIQSVLGSSFAF